VRLRARHQRPGEARGIHLRGGFRRAERRGDHARAVEPARCRDAVAAADRAPLARGQHEGVHAAVAVIPG
jgi:hypothetical protein